MESKVSPEIRQTMVISGARLDIIATRICEGEWTLSVENCDGIRSVWCEFFDSPEAALEAGRKAVETEGVEEFVSREGFEYLF